MHSRICMLGSSWGITVGEMGYMSRSQSEQRSKIMRAVRSRDTGPELQLRKLLSNMGYRYRLHQASLPGRPDISFASRQKAIFIHGCFWHQHPRCKYGRMPKSNLRYWMPKLRRNVQRDRKNQLALRDMGWSVLIIWQCKLRQIEAESIQAKLRKFLGPPPSTKRRATNTATS